MAVVSIMGSAVVMPSMEQFWDKGPGGSTLEARHRLVLLDLIASIPFLGLKTSESEKTSPCIELTSEIDGEQDLVLGGRGGACEDWHLLGGKGGGLVGDVLGVDVKIGRVSSFTISNSLS